MYIQTARGFIHSKAKTKCKPNCLGPVGKEPGIVPITVVGESNVGKSAIIRHFRGQKFSKKYTPTVGMDRSQIFVERPDDISDPKLVFKFIETNDAIVDPDEAQTFEDKIDSLLAGFSLYVLVVYDITSHKTFEAAKDWVTLMRDIVETDVTFILVGNKADSPHREVHQSAGEVFAMLYDTYFIETSAKTDFNMSNLLNFLIDL